MKQTPNRRKLVIATILVAFGFLLLLLCAVQAIVGFHLYSKDTLVGICIAGITLLLVFLQDFIKKYIIRYMVPFRVFETDVPRPPKWLVRYSVLYANSVAACILAGAGGSLLTAFWQGGYSNPSMEILAIMLWAIGTLMVMQFFIVTAWVTIRAANLFWRLEHKTLAELFFIIRKEFFMRKPAS